MAKFSSVHRIFAGLIIIVVTLSLLSLSFYVQIMEKIHQTSSMFSSVQTKPGNCACLINETNTKRTGQSRITLSETAAGKLLLALRQHVLDLTETQRSLAFSEAHFQKLGHHIQVTKEIMKLLRKELQTSNPLSFDRKRSQDIRQKQEVCPEKYIGNSSLYAWPFFRKGFSTVDCKDFVPMRELVTILISVPKELRKPTSHLNIAKGVAKYYPKIRVISAMERSMEDKTNSFIVNLDIKFENEVISGTDEATLWRRMIEKVRTPYVLIARHVTHFDDDINLERLVRVLSNNPHVVIAGGSYRNPKGEWDIGCQQVSFRNWTASYMSGYYHSFSECIVCDFMPGPWMAKTHALKELDFDPQLKDGVFRDLFWRLKNRAVSCPDVMFNINIPEVKDEDYVMFANKHQIHKIVEPNGRIRWYGCRRGYSYTSPTLCTKTRGLGLQPSDMENLADAIKFLMKECENAGIFCEIQYGTLLGAVKLGSILPWERDADVVFLASNFSALENLTSVLAVAGYKLAVVNREKYMRVGRLVHGAFSLKFGRWRIDLIGHKAMESEMLAASGQQPTKVHFAGQWVNVMRNPGLFARNFYRQEIYKHQEHNGQAWGRYHPGSFPICPQTGHSACLDRYPTDGNMQFSDYCPR